jgi:6-phospho-3-hexuloisomerase
MTQYASVLTPILRELEAVLNAVDGNSVNDLATRIAGTERVFLAGMGRSGLHVRAFAMRLMHLGLRSHVVGEVTAPGIGKGDLLLIGSGSGRTPSLVEHAKVARRLGSQVALITADPGAPLAAFADELLVLPAPTPKAEGLSSEGSIQPLGTLFEQALGLLCDAIVLLLMERMDVQPEEMFARHANLE